MTLIRKSKETRRQLKQNWLEKLAPIGSDPWSIVLKANKFAGPDECDFNFHLSNSSYPKVLDEVRMQTAFAFFPNFFRGGGWLALGGNHFTFHREIPMLAHYELRTNIGSWDEKWLYIVTRYVTRPNNKKSRSGKDANSGSVTSLDSAPIPVLHTPATGTNTPSSTSNGQSPQATSLLTESSMRKEEPDGATLNCVNVSEICFKVGRITVPPAIALALNGCCLPSMSEKPYSHENVPPYWENVRKMLADPKDAQKFMSGGWRELPVEERWWEHALGGAIEEKRKVTLELVQGVRRGMEGAKSVY